VIRAAGRAAIIILLLATTLAADPDADFRAAAELAAKNDPQALAAFEALGAARPVSRWTDDAWVEAARIAERARYLDRARKDLGEAIAISDDAQLTRRAKRDLERLTELTGAGGEWSAVSARHDQLISALASGGDPTSRLEELESIAKANPGYPRGVALRIALARAWDQEDEADRAVSWLRDALRLPRPEHARIELVRVLIRHRWLDEARRELAAVDDKTTRASLARSLQMEETRSTRRWIALALLGGLAIAAALLLRRRTGSLRATAKHLARPPAEIRYFLPIALVVAGIAVTGNPLVAKAVVWILGGAGAIAWISGATIEAARPVSTRHALVHAAVVGCAVLLAVYVALDHARLLDLVEETWRTGPGH
jgi:predicted negative regulator of RcsB-dependent stress response